MEKWVKLGHEYVLDSKWLKVRKDIVRLPNGMTLDDYFVLEYPTWVNVIAITEDGRFVMERQYRHGLGQIDFEICAGTCENGEDPQTAAKRELLEETGYAEGNWNLYGITTPNPAAMTNLNYTYLATGVKKVSVPHQELSEDIDILLMTLEEVRELMDKGQITQGCMLAMLWKYMVSNME